MSLLSKNWLYAHTHTHRILIKIQIGQVAGWTQAYGHTVKGKQESILTYTTIRGGGHEMPYTNPSEALTLYRSFIRALPFPSS